MNPTLFELIAGDLPGHEFHGNQYADGMAEYGEALSQSRAVHSAPNYESAQLPAQKLDEASASASKVADESGSARAHTRAMQAHRLASAAHWTLAVDAPDSKSKTEHQRAADHHESEEARHAKHLDGNHTPRALTGISTSISAAAIAAKDPRDLWVVFIPKGERQVVQQTLDLQPVLDDKGQPASMKINPSVLSAKRLEAARQQIAKRGGEQPYTDFNHQDQEASGTPVQFAWDDKLGVVCRIRRTLTGLQKTDGAPAEFQSFSPHAPIDDDGEAIGLYLNCGGFVNRALFGDATHISAAGKLNAELVAADPNDVARISAALDNGETQSAAQGEKQMKQLTAKLCAAWKLDPDKVTEADLIAAFEHHQTSVATLTARAGIVEPVIVALGFDAKAEPKPEELTGKIAALSKRDDVIALKDHASEVADIAIAAGIISPAEKGITVSRLTGAARGEEFKALVAKKPTVPLGTVVHPANVAQGADANGKTAEPWEQPLKELVAKDSELSKIAAGDMPRARSMGLVRLMAERPELFQPVAVTK